MKALNLEGQKIIDEAIRVRKNNKLLIIDKIRSAITYIKHNDIGPAENDIFDAYELINESIHNTFICVEGLKPLVINDCYDAINHNELSAIGERLYREVCMKIVSLKKEKHEGINVTCFQSARIKKIMESIFYNICFIEPMESLI